MLTEKQLEAAARELCRLRGEDPDELVAHEEPVSRSGWQPAMLTNSPQWRLAKVEIQNAENLAAACSVGAALRELVSLQEFNDKRREKYERSISSVGEPMPNGIACPKCGKGLFDTEPNFSLSSSPPQKHVGCKACEFVGYRVA